MKIVKPSCVVDFHYPAIGVIGGAPHLQQPVAFLERVARTCYKTEPKGDANRFVAKLAELGHHAMLEHCFASAQIVADRGVSHELVRHRLASFAQESTRWCNYSLERFDQEITVIEPPGLEGTIREQWIAAMTLAESVYMAMIKGGLKPQIARSVLPTCLKTEIWISANLREWMHIFKLRLAPDAHPQMREVMRLALPEFVRVVPVLFRQFEEEQ